MTPYTRFWCSKCNRVQFTKNGTPKYCPECGNVQLEVIP